MTQAIVEVNRLSKRFCRNPKRTVGYAARDIISDITLRSKGNQLRADEFWALKDIDFRVNAGEVFGVIGHNGAGKSTLLNLVKGTLRPTIGRITLNARTAISFGGNALNPVLTGRENIVNKLSLFGMPSHEIGRNLEPVIEFSELGKSIDSPTGSYSTGMNVRLAFAIYTALRPDLLIVDEGLNGGDLKFHRKFQKFLDGYIASGGTILLASHNLPLIELLCQRCILIENGEVVSGGKPCDVIDAYHKLTDERRHAASPSSATAENSFWSETLGATVLDQKSNLVQIESVEIMAPGGGSITAGGSAVVEIVCHATDVISAACGLEIGTTEIFPLAVLGKGHILERGRNVLRCIIDSLPLVPGTYGIAVSIVNVKNGAILATKGYHGRPNHFSVVGVPNMLDNVARYRQSHVHLSASWTVSARN